MINAPVAAQLLLLLLLAFGVLVVVLEIRALSYAYRAIGIAPRYVTAILLLTLLGSYVNIPLYAVPVARLLPPQMIEHFGRVYIVPPALTTDMSLVAINVGSSRSWSRSTSLRRPPCGCGCSSASRSWRSSCTPLRISSRASASQSRC